MLNEQEKALIFKLAENLTGCSQTGDTRQDSLVSNVERRLRELKLGSLAAYLQRVEEDPNEHAHLISALTIHTTSWFRENPHFVIFQELLLDAVQKNEVFTLWCAACSTGEEVYSFGLMLEEFRRVHPKFEYHIVGTDIDPVSVAVAQRAIYNEKHMNFHLGRYKQHLLLGSGKTQGYFTISKEIRNRCVFRVNDLRNSVPLKEAPVHVVVCRNVLIYFSKADVERVVRNVLGNLKPEGHLFVGHSEPIHGPDFNVTQRGHAVFCNSRQDRRQTDRQRARYRILSIDDSASARKLLKKLFTDIGFDSLSVASASEATEFLKDNEVDLITLDLHMPNMNGDAWLTAERKAGLKTPVVILSDVHAADAEAVVHLLARGAQEYIEKSQLMTDPRLLRSTFVEIIRGRENVHKHKTRATGGAFPLDLPELTLIGASTGGPQALVKLLSQMPSGSPPILITQHISPKFTRPLAERLASVSGLTLGKVENDAPVLPGHLYLPYDDYHLGVDERDGQLTLQLSTSHPVNGHRPSVDVMYNSLVGIARPAIAILLTGMGRDGAAGLKVLRQEGVFCVAQSEEDCIVYGMPREAIERDAADFIGNIDQIRSLMLESFGLKKKRSA